MFFRPRRIQRSAQKAKHTRTNCFEAIPRIPQPTLWVQTNEHQRSACLLHWWAHFYRPYTKYGEGNVFTGVCLFTGRVCIPTMLFEGRPPLEGKAYLRRQDPPEGRSPIRNRSHLRTQTHLRRQTSTYSKGKPPSKKVDPLGYGYCYRIWSTNGPYASYWNTSLLQS